MPIFGRMILALLGGFVSAHVLSHFSKKKIFISFAIEDKHFRDLLVGQAKNKKAPFEFRDYSVHQPWSNAWKTECRKKIDSSDAFIGIITRNTELAEGALWEIRCALELKKPLLLLRANKNESNLDLLPQFPNIKTKLWNWRNLKSFLRTLEK